MRNSLAISAAIAAILLSLAGLAATIFAVWPEDEPAASATAPAFVPTDIGQPRPVKRAPKNEFIGPTMDDANTEQAEEKTTKKTAPSPRPKANKRKYKPAVLQVVTNFDQADVKVNGLPYPEYFEPGEPEGMVLPAGGPYNVEVKFGTNTKVYNLHLRPHETRLLLVELSGYNSSAPPPPPPPRKAAEPAKKEEKKEEKKDEKESGGKITVYSKPAGTVIVDGKETGEKTPGSVELENGRHEVQVKYESGSISEKKIVRVRNGSRIKLFFRERKQ